MDGERVYTLKASDNPHHIDLYYICKGEYASVTLDLSKSDFSLTQEEAQVIYDNVQFKRSKSSITSKRISLRIFRSYLIETTGTILEILAMKTLNVNGKAPNHH
jgi:hypothetical protein